MGNGLASVNINITDSSFLTNSGSKGICNVLGITERGPVSSPVLVSSWFEYQRTFGGLLSTSNFPLLCKRILDGGGILYVGRVAHYTTITVANTLTGTKAVSSDTNHQFSAKSIGTWGNGLTVTVTDLPNAKRKVVIALVDYPRFTQEFEVSAVWTAEDIALINSSAYYVDTIAEVGDALSAASLTFSAGTESDTVVDADYIGSDQTSTGLYAFNAVTESWYMAIPDQAKNTLDVALVAYCDGRKDLRPILRTPVGLTKTAIVQYRTAVSPYAGTAINSWRALMFTGGLKVNHPTTNAVTTLSEIGDVIARFCTKDNKGNTWDAFSGAQWGKIPNVIGVVINFGSPALTSDGKDLVDNGVNPVIAHSTFKTVIWGNRSLYADTRKVLKYAHVGDIIMHLQRYINPLAELRLFQPNIPATWRSLYNAIQPELDRLKSLGAIAEWQYNGDQYVDKIQDAQFNTLEDIDNGKYQAFIRLFVNSKMEYIDLYLDVSGTSALLQVQTQ